MIPIVEGLVRYYLKCVSVLLGHLKVGLTANKHYDDTNTLFYNNTNNVHPALYYYLEMVCAYAHKVEYREFRILKNRKCAHENNLLCIFSCYSNVIHTSYKRL